MKSIAKFFGIILIGVLVSSSSSVEKKRIVIDAGHGGKDKGVVINSIQEKDLNLKVAMLIKELNTNKNLEVVLLRDTDEFVSLEDRVAKVNELKPELLISIHHNAKADATENGMEIFVCPESQNYEASQKKAQSMLIALTDKLKSKGVKESNFTILKKTDCPAILIELGYLTNLEDFTYLTSELGSKELANSILATISN